jgi:hypothetical protein
MPVCDVEIEQVHGIGDLHEGIALAAHGSELVDDGVHAAGEVVGRGDLDVRARGRLGGEVGGHLHGAESRPGLDDVRAQDVPAALDEIRFPKVEIHVAARLVVKAHGVPPS